MSGRPTLYSPELVEKAKDYEENWDTLYEGDVLPTIEGLALHLGISRETIYSWEGQDEKEAFSDIVGRIRHKQAKTLINKGLKGEFNAPITKVMLTKHNYREGLDHTTDDQPISSNVENRAHSILNEQGTTTPGDN